jgi:tetratricopeptide (TPR) repeat protein
MARELQVDAIVEGTVARVGNRVRISAKLVNAQTDLHLWAESYDRDLRDVLALQSEVARSIAREIQIKTTPQEQAHLAKARLVDPAAYEAYLKGRHYWNRRNGESLKKAIECFQQAIDRDPTYAAAYVGLADCAGVSGWWGLVPPDEGSVKSKVTALKALEIEETAEARASMGWAHMYCDWDFTSSEKEFQRAIELNPRYATAHQWYGHCLGCLRRFDDAFAEIELALELDPLSLIIRASYAGMLWCANRCEEAIEQSEKILDLDPTFLGGHWSLGVAYKGSRQFQKAIDEFKKGVQLSGGSAFFIAELGHAYAIAGERSGALEILQQLQDLSSHRYINGCWIAQIYAGLRDYDAAFDWLDKGFAQRSESMAHLQMFPVLYDLHSDPRFNTLLRRMKFPVG